MFQASLDDHVKDLNLVTLQPPRDVLELQGLTDHDMLKADRMMGHRWTNEKNPHKAS
jgi:hypothetical protein